VVQQLLKAGTTPGQTLGALYAGVWSASLCSVVIGKQPPATSEGFDVGSGGQLGQ
jgi:hypothetical protein